MPWWRKGPPEPEPSLDAISGLASQSFKSAKVLDFWLGHAFLRVSLDDEFILACQNCSRVEFRPYWNVGKLSARQVSGHRIDQYEVLDEGVFLARASQIYLSKHSSLGSLGGEFPLLDYRFHKASIHERLRSVQIAVSAAICSQEKVSDVVQACLDLMRTGSSPGQQMLDALQAEADTCLSNSRADQAVVPADSSTRRRESWARRHSALAALQCLLAGSEAELHHALYLSLKAMNDEDRLLELIERDFSSIR